MLIRKLSGDVRCMISTIKQSLKILQLSTPTTKVQIKKKYLIMAKKYHPDSAMDNNKEKISELKKQLEQKFININKAYQYLREMTEDQINLNKDKNDYNSSTGKASSQASYQAQDRKYKVSAQQLKRHQTYEYFNKRFQQQSQSYSNDHLQKDQYRSPKRKPLIKTVPELFVGFLLLALMLGDWSYRIYKRSKAEDQTMRSEVSRGSLTNSYYTAEGESSRRNNTSDASRPRNPFKSMNHNTVFSKKDHIE